MSKQINKYKVMVEVANYQDIFDFATSLLNIKSFTKLTSDEKLKIVMSYPFKLKFKQNKAKIHYL